MKIEDFIEKIEEEFEDIETGSVKPDTVFRDVFEWNSINALIYIAMVKTEYDVSINAEEIASSKTIQDLFDLISKKVEAGQTE